MRNFSLSSKIFLAFLLAVFLPVLILAIFSFTSVESVALENLESFISESGARRQEAIENDIRTALNYLNEFTSANQSELQAALALRSGVLNPTASARLETQIQNAIRSQLIPSESFYGVSILDLQFSPFATATTGQTPSIGFNRQDSEDIEPVARNMNIAAGDSQAFVVTNRNGVTHIEVINAVLLNNEAGEAEVIGYVVADLNLDVIIRDNLLRQEGSYDTYAYLILAQTREVIAPAEVLEEGLIDDTSEGAERALIGRQAASIYEVGEEANRREVLGYSTRIEIDNEQFALVTEGNTSSIREQIVQQGAQRIFPFTVGAIAFSLIVAIIMQRNIVSPLGRVRDAILELISGNYEQPVADVRRGDEIGALATSFVDMREYVREQNDEMNRRLRERTRDVQVTQDIGRTITAERDLERLMSRVVNLIVQNFPTIYHAQIFLLDEDRQFAVLRSSTGQAGRELLSRGHKLGVGSVSVIGQVTEQGHLIVARDTSDSTVHRQNEFLGETRAELAIPLRLGEEIIGALDVQSKEQDSFDEDLVAALQTLADQITIAIENARLYAESARLLASIASERGTNTQAAWQEYMYQQRKDSLVIQAGVSTGYEFEKLRQAVALSGKSVVGDATSRATIPFAVPIILRGQILGIVEYEVPQAEFDYDKVLLAEELVSRLAISLENARLFQTSQEATDRERIVNEISTKLTGQTDIEEILQTAIREVGQALRTPQIAIRLQSNGKNGNHQTEEASL